MITYLFSLSTDYFFTPTDSKTAAHKGQLQALNLYKYTGTDHIIFPVGISRVLFFVYHSLVQYQQIAVGVKAADPVFTGLVEDQCIP